MQRRSICRPYVTTVPAWSNAVPEDTLRSSVINRQRGVIEARRTRGPISRRELSISLICPRNQTSPAVRTNAPSRTPPTEHHGFDRGIPRTPVNRAEIRGIKFARACQRGGSDSASVLRRRPRRRNSRTLPDRPHAHRVLIHFHCLVLLLSSLRQ